MDESLYELVDLYLNGTLPPDHPFVEKVKIDTELAREVEKQKLVKDAVIDYRLLQFQSKIKQYHENSVQTENAFGIKKIVAALALVLLLTGMLGFIYYKNYRSEKNAQKMHGPFVLENTDANKLPIENTNISPNATRQAPQAIQSNAQQQKISTIPKKGENVPLTAHEDSSFLHPAFRVESANDDGVSHAQVGSRSPQDPCQNVKLYGKITATPSCAGKSDGSLSVEDIGGGLDPYHFSIDKGAHFQDKPQFSDLAQGYYSILVRDRNNCMTVIDSSYYLSQKNCHIVQNLTFNPNYTPYLEITKEGSDNAIFSIYDKSGRVVLTKTISATDKIIWDGTADGQLVLPGLYVYIIQYTSQKEEHGTVTIMY